MSALPTLTSEGRKNIDSFLEETVESRRVPAVFFGATNAKEEIYFNQAGEKAFGDASQGDIGPDTSESTAYPSILEAQALVGGLPNVYGFDGPMFDSQVSPSLRIAVLIIVTELWSQTKFFTCVSLPQLQFPPTNRVLTPSYALCNLSSRVSSV
jgi:hypothetical protein